MKQNNWTWENFCRVYGQKMLLRTGSLNIFLNGKKMGNDECPLLTDIVNSFSYCMKNGQTYKMTVSLSR